MTHKAGCLLRSDESPCIQCFQFLFVFCFDRGVLSRRNVQCITNGMQLFLPKKEVALYLALLKACSFYIGVNVPEMACLCHHYGTGAKNYRA